MRSSLAIVAWGIGAADIVVTAIRRAIELPAAVWRIGMRCAGADLVGILTLPSAAASSGLVGIYRFPVSCLPDSQKV